MDLENGGVRAVGFIVADYVPFTGTGLINKAIVETDDYWETGITDGKIHIIANTRGTYDGGSAVTTPGWGDVKEVVLGKNMTLVFNDRDHKQNEEFYAAMANAPGVYHAAWRTDRELRISETPVNIDPVDNTEEGVDSVVAWACTVTWTQKRKTVQIFDLTPEIKKMFSCFELEP
jgi:hypothetical protein